jgi:hypothetical protein
MCSQKLMFYVVAIYHEESYGNIKMDTNCIVALGCILHRISKILPKDTGTLKYQHLRTESAYSPAFLVHEISFPKGTLYLASLLCSGISFDCRNYLLIHTYPTADEDFGVNILIIIN